LYEEFNGDFITASSYKKHFFFEYLISDFDIWLYAPFNMDRFRFDRVCIKHVVCDSSRLFPKEATHFYGESMFFESNK
jgi:hypothetical protein